MGTDLKNYIAREFNKSKKKAKAMLLKGYDTTELISKIKKIRKKLNQEDREITQRDLIQHLAIQLSQQA